MKVKGALRDENDNIIHVNGTYDANIKEILINGEIVEVNGALVDEEGNIINIKGT